MGVSTSAAAVGIGLKLTGALDSVGREELGDVRGVDADVGGEVDEGHHLAGPGQWLLAHRVRVTDVGVDDLGEGVGTGWGVGLQV